MQVWLDQMLVVQLDSIISRKFTLHKLPL